MHCGPLCWCIDFFPDPYSLFTPIYRRIRKKLTHVEVYSFRKKKCFDLRVVTATMVPPVLPHSFVAFQKKIQMWYENQYFERGLQKKASKRPKPSNTKDFVIPNFPSPDKARQSIQGYTIHLAFMHQICSFALAQLQKICPCAAAQLQKFVHGAYSPASSPV